MDWTAFFIMLASSNHSTIYGTSEVACGDIESPTECKAGAVTASGEKFYPGTVPSAAVPMPTHLIIRPRMIGLRHTTTGKCIKIKLNDKANPRWIGNRGLDLTPAALLAIGIMPTNYWSRKVELC